MKKVTTACFVLLSLPPLSSAQNLIQDGGFENISGTSWRFDLGPEWSGVSEAISWNPQPSGLDGVFIENVDSLTGISAAREGDYMAFVSNPKGETFQAVGTTIGDTYTFSGLLGNGEARERIQSASQGGAVVAAFVDDVVVFQLEEGEWGEFSHTFKAASTATKISIGFVQPDAGSSSMYVVADNFSLVQVPEPSSAILSALGVLGLLVQRRRS